MNVEDFYVIIEKYPWLLYAMDIYNGIEYRLGRRFKLNELYNPSWIGNDLREDRECTDFIRVGDPSQVSMQSTDISNEQYGEPGGEDLNLDVTHFIYWHELEQPAFSRCENLLENESIIQAAKRIIDSNKLIPSCLDAVVKKFHVQRTVVEEDMAELQILKSIFNPHPDSGTRIGYEIYFLQKQSL